MKWRSIFIFKLNKWMNSTYSLVLIWNFANPPRAMWKWGKFTNFHEERAALSCSCRCRHLGAGFGFFTDRRSVFLLLLLCVCVLFRDRIFSSPSTRSILYRDHEIFHSGPGEFDVSCIGSWVCLTNIRRKLHRIRQRCIYNQKFHFCLSFIYVIMDDLIGLNVIQLSVIR